MAANPMDPCQRPRPGSVARRLVAVATAALLVGTVSAAFGSPAPAGAARLAAAPVPGTGRTVFPADNIWNTNVSTLPVDPKSGAWLASMNAGSTNLHPDFGQPPYGLPF